MLHEKARELFIEASPYPGPALEYHNLRIARFTLALARQIPLPLDEDLVYAASYLHDIGLLLEERREPNYLRRGWTFARPYARQWGVEGEPLELLAQMMLTNHALAPPAGLLPGADLFRRAVRVEHSRGLWRQGLDPAFCQQTFQELPRLNLTWILLDFARITFVEDGPRQLLPLFFPQL